MRLASTEASPPRRTRGTLWADLLVALTSASSVSSVVAMFVVSTFLCALGASASIDSLETTFFDALEHPAIGYATRPANDPVAALNRKLAGGDISFRFDPANGYLRSTLDALGIAVQSQIAVFSKTSVQARIIDQSNPRTIFFNDEVAVGWMRDGFIELAAQDPQQGVIFYALPQQQTPTPQFLRANGCLQCHHSYATLGVPGMLTRSVVTARNGMTLPFLGNYVTDHRSPYEERWAGRYVTGSAGAMRHMGNVTVIDPNKLDESITSETLNVKSLEGRFDTSTYLSSQSDIAALLVFDHQMRMMNLLTRVGWEARVSSDPEALREHAKEFVDYLLLVDEAPLPGKVQGSTDFAAKFASLGPRDSQGRSLRELDLEHRLLRYSCSYMIYSAAFDALPAQAKAAIYARLADVLAGRESSARYARLSPANRQAIAEILRDTKPDFPRR